MSVDENQLRNQLADQMNYLKESVLKLIEIIEDLDKRVTALEEKKCGTDGLAY